MSISTAPSDSRQNPAAVSGVGVVVVRRHDSNTSGEYILLHYEVMREDPKPAKD